MIISALSEEKKTCTNWLFWIRLLTVILSFFWGTTSFITIAAPTPYLNDCFCLELYKLQNEYNFPYKHEF